MDKVTTETNALLLEEAKVLAKSHQLKRIEFSDGGFIANGKPFLIEPELSYNRWIWYQKCEVYATLGKSFKEILALLNKAYALLNTGQPKPTDAGIIIRNVMQGVIEVDEERLPTIMLMAALFINRPDEDRSVFDLNMAREKILDWAKEGIRINDFFTFVLSVIPGFQEAFSNISLNTSQEKVTLKGFPENSKTSKD